MERVLNLSWQWVRDWVPPGLTAIALVACLVGLWFIMMEADARHEARGSVVATRATGPTLAAESSRSEGQQATYRAAGSSSSARVQTDSTDAESAAVQADCLSLREEIDAVGARVRAFGKSRQSARYRTRLSELRQVYAEECVRG